MSTSSPLISLSTGSLYHWPLETVFRLGKELGLDGLELVLGPEALLRGPSHLARLQQAHGIRVLSLHPPILPIPGWLKFSVLASKLAMWARDLSIPVVTIHTPDIERLDGDQGRRYVAVARRLADDLACFDARLALENRARFRDDEGPMCLDQPTTLRDCADSLGAGVTFDTAHAGTLYPDVLGAFEILAPRVANVHLSDLNGRGGGPFARWTDTILRHHQIPGNGSLPIEAILGRLSSFGYAGPVTLEISPVALGAWRPAETRRRLGASVDYVRQRIS